jgi:uncharacterized membrane protein YgcG
MSQDKRGGFSWRAFISLTTALSFVGMCVTGVILFVVPPGRVANWTGWTLLALSKDQWQGLHIWLSLVFMVAAVIHTVLNWRPLVSYLKSRVSRSFAMRWEWVAALLICVAATVGTLANVTPFSSLLDWNEAIKYSWDDRARRAPIPHAELLTLAELAGHVEGLDVETITANLRAGGIEVDSTEDVVGDLARAYGMSPDRLYNIATGGQPRGRGRGGAGGGRGAGGQGLGGGGGRGSGFGRMTLAQYCTQAGLEVDVALETLREAGFEPTADMTMRDIADAKGVHPSELRRVLE